MIPDMETGELDVDALVAAAIVRKARAGEQAARDCVAIACATPADKRTDFQRGLFAEACKPGPAERREMRFGASGWSF